VINVKVKPNKSENTVSLLRRFSKRVQGAGILSKAKSLRFRERDESSFVKKKGKLRKIEKKKKIEKMLKMGQPIKRKKRRF
jgi:ribosomal protein S21